MASLPSRCDAGALNLRAKRRAHPRRERKREAPRFPSSHTHGPSSEADTDRGVITARRGILTTLAVRAGPDNERYAPPKTSTVLPCTPTPKDWQKSRNGKRDVGMGPRGLLGTMVRRRELKILFRRPLSLPKVEMRSRPPVVGVIRGWPSIKMRPPNSTSAILCRIRHGHNRADTSCKNIAQIYGLH